MGKEDLKYIPDYKQCKRITPPLTHIKQYLGSFDAEKEWKDNNAEAYKRFLNIGAYKVFTEEESLLLIGRTGTGKTAILNCYMYDVLNERLHNSKLKYAIKLDLKSYIMELAKYGEISDKTFIQNEIERNIEIIVNLAVMQEIVKKGINKNEKDFESIRKYVNSQSFSSNFIEQCTNEIGNIYSDNEVGRIIGTIGVLTKFAQKYVSVDYQKAVDSLHRILKNGDFLVLIDSMDTYDIREVSVVYIVKALIETCFRFYNYNSEWHIQLKIAMLAEIYSHIVSTLPEKHQANTVAIEWKYRELVKMIALRVLYYCNSANDVFAELKDRYTYKDFYDNYQNAKDFLTIILPQNCPASKSMQFDTIAYCIRHTQKKPRQLMKIFHMFMSVIIKSNDLSYFYHNVNKITTRIHMVQEDMIKDAISMYNLYTDNEIINICNCVLSNRRVDMSKKEFTDCIKTAAKIYKKSENYLDEEDILRILVESGLVGKYDREDLIEKGNDVFQNNNVIKIVTTLFEYQIKGNIYFASNDKVIIHPMCYEYFTNIIDYNALIYPAPIDDDDDVIMPFIEDDPDN